MSLGLDGVTYEWNAIEGATRYLLRGEMHVVRGNAVDPFCTPPLEVQGFTAPIQAEIAPTSGNGMVRYTVGLPELPPGDRWYVAFAQAQVDAFDVEGTLIATGGHSIVAETMCVRPTPSATPLGSAIALGDCAIPAGYREITTQAAIDRGQRVFLSPEEGTRIYVRADGSCVFLHGAVDPIPEFAPEGDLGATALARQAADAGVWPPNTGSGAGSHPSTATRSALLVAAGLTGMALAIAGLALARRRA